MIFQSPLVLDQLKINLEEQSRFYIEMHMRSRYKLTTKGYFKVHLLNKESELLYSMSVKVR